MEETTLFNLTSLEPILEGLVQMSLIAGVIFVVLGYLIKMEPEVENKGFYIVSCLCFTASTLGWLIGNQLYGTNSI